ASGTTKLTGMGSEELFHSTYFELGLAMILIGLGFKVAAAPFQVWTPDVYEGAPTPVTALFSAGPKAAAFALLLRIFATVPAATHFWFWAFWVAAALSVYLLSLLGLPVTAGFFGKFYIFKAAVNSHLLWLAVLMAINSVIGAYYYLRVIVVMYMRESSAEAAAAPPVGFPLTVNFVLAFTVAGTLYFGLFPNQVLNFILQPTLLGH